MSNLDDVNDSSFYKWKFFYFNKNDKRIFPPKPEDQIGFQVNFGNPKSVLALFIALLFFGFIIYMICNFKK